MAFNGSGIFSLAAGNPVTTGTTISSTWANNTLSDIATGLSTTITKDGQTTPTANIPMGGFKFTGLGAGTATGNSIRWEQLFSQGAPAALASAATTDIGVQTSVAVEISGTTTITSFGTNYNGPRFLRFTGALILTHSATLNLPGAANITTVAGDTAIAYPNAAQTGWNVLSYNRASGIPSGTAASGANSDITSMSALTSINILPGYLFGCTMSTAGSSTTMSIAAGRATDSTGLQSMALSAIAKTTSTWAVGTAAGGKSLAAAIANSTWYHFYMIRRPDTGVVDVCFSTNATGLVAADFVAGGGNVPDAYTQFRRIGSMRTNASAQWESFVQDGDLFLWSSPVADFTVTNPTASAVLRALKTPLGIQTVAVLNVSNSGSTLSSFYFSDPATTDIAATNANSQVSLPSSATFGNCQIQIRTNTSSQIRARASVSDGSTLMVGTTTAYYDTRGKNA